jgi:signal transduction histidine kinase
MMLCFTIGSSVERSGLGLYLAKRIVTHLGGDIELIEDVSVKGCKFRITLLIDVV